MTRDKFIIQHWFEINTFGNAECYEITLDDENFNKEFWRIYDYLSSRKRKRMKKEIKKIIIKELNL